MGRGAESQDHLDPSSRGSSRYLVARRSVVVGLVPIQPAHVHHVPGGQSGPRLFRAAGIFRPGSSPHRNARVPRVARLQILRHRGTGADPGFLHWLALAFPFGDAIFARPGTAPGSFTGDVDIKRGADCRIDPDRQRGRPRRRARRVSFARGLDRVQWSGILRRHRARFVVSQRVHEGSERCRAEYHCCLSDAVSGNSGGIVSLAGLVQRIRMAVPLAFRSGRGRPVVFPRRVPALGLAIFRRRSVTGRAGLGGMDLVDAPESSRFGWLPLWSPSPSPKNWRFAGTPRGDGWPPISIS